MTLDEFARLVSIRMLTVYGIDWDDACGDSEPLCAAISDGWSADEFVDWWGQKYDLDPLSLFGLTPPYERIANLSGTKHDIPLV
jgi:hypothetical protein